MSDMWVCLCSDKHIMLVFIHVIIMDVRLTAGCVSSFCKSLWPSSEQLVFASKWVFSFLFSAYL